MRIFWIGFPGLSGGANTECWHTVKMLRRNGVDVTFLPTEGAAKVKLASATLDDLPKIHRERLEGIGCKIQLVPAHKLKDVDGLAGSVIVSMCNSNFLDNAHHYRRLGCKVVWVNCMTFLFPSELRHYTQYGKTFEAYVMQSDWQRSRIELALCRRGHDRNRTHIIRGPLDLEKFPYRPRAHAPGERFVIGKLSRADEDKWSSMLWDYYDAIKKKLDCPMRARVMAWDDRLKKKLRGGRPPAKAIPDYVKTLKSCAEPVPEFLGRLHALVQWNGGAGENWPRTGLEAMASGVPLVVQNKWGWREMLRHNETGLLCEDKPGEVGEMVAELARDESYRLGICEAARAQVEEYADESEIWPKWEAMLKGLEG